MLEFGRGGFNASEHPPTGDQGNVANGEGVGEPLSWARNSWCSGEWDVEEFKLEGVLERSGSLTTFDAAKDLLHKAV